MPIDNPNYQSKSTKLLQELLKPPRIYDPIVLIDIGAAGGARREWLSITDISRIICFEPDVAECERLNKTAPPYIEYFPNAIGEISGKFPFFLARSGLCSGLTKINEFFWKRFPNWQNNEIVSEAQIECISLKDWSKSANCKHVDFIKLDVEGSESAILRGADDLIEEKKILGILSEYAIEGDTRLASNYGLFSIDQILKKYNFQLFDLTTSRFPRSTLPVGKLNISKSDSDSQFSVSASPTRAIFGQLLAGDVLYFRDPIMDLRKKGSEYVAKFWDRETLLRLICLLDVYNYTDFSLEILSHFRHFFSNDELDFVVKTLLTTVVDEIEYEIPYDEYFKASKELFIQNGGLNGVDIINHLVLEPAVFANNIGGTNVEKWPWNQFC